MFLLRAAATGRLLIEHYRDVAFKDNARFSGSSAARDDALVMQLLLSDSTKYDLRMRVIFRGRPAQFLGNESWLNDTQMDGGPETIVAYASVFRL